MKITEKDLLLEYLKDKGAYPATYKYQEVEYDHTTNDRKVEVECPECGHEFTENIWGQDESGETEVYIDNIIDPKFHDWCIEKLLEYKNKENEKDI